jgi:hypothetical protein
VVFQSPSGQIPGHVTCPLKARIAETEMSATKQWLCEHVSMATKFCDRSNRYAKIEEWLEAVFSVGSLQMLYKGSHLVL